MREVLFERNASASVDRPRFQANVRFLIDKEGLTKARITELIDEFARRVQVGQINVDGKPAWGVFMGTWRKLGGSASADGLAKKQKTWTRDDIR